MIELSRSKKTRLPDAPDGRKRYAINASLDVIQMKEDGGDWEDIDPTLDSKGVPKTVPYDLIPYLTGMPGFHYKSKQLGEFDVRIKEARLSPISITPISLNPNSKPVIKGRTITWVDYYPDVDIVLTMGNACVVLNRIIKSANAPLEYDVEIIEVEKGQTKLMPLKPAEDANGQLIKMEEKPCLNGRTETLKLEVVEQEGIKIKPIAYPIKDSTIIDDRPIDAVENDADENSSGSCTIGGAVLNLLNVNYWIGFRFVGISIPAAAIIAVTYMNVYLPDDSDDYFSDKDIYCEDGNNPGVFVGGGNYNISLRDRTTEVTTLTAGAQGTGWKTTTSFVDEVQEVVDDNAGTGDALIFIWHCTANVDLKIYAWDYSDHSYAPQVYIEYSEAGGVNYPISLSPGLVASAIIGRDVAWDRTMSRGLTISATVVAVFGRLITTIANLTASATVDREVAYKRASSSGLTTAVTILKGWGRSITTTTDLTASVTVLKGWGRSIATTSNLAVSVTVSRIHGFVKSVVSNLTASTVITRAVAWIRIIGVLFVGSEAIDRGTEKINLRMYLSVDNPASYTGLITSVEVWVETSMTNLIVGTFFNVGGRVFECRDSVNVGSITAGAKRTITGLSLAVETGDYIGQYCDTGAIESDVIGGAGLEYYNGEAKDTGDQATYILIASQRMSLKGIGPEPWTGLSVSSTVVKSFGKMIATSAGLAISVTINRAITYTRATLANLTISVTILKGWGRKITTTTGLTVAVTIVATFVGITQYLITVVTNLTASATIVKGWGRTIATTTDLAVAVSMLKGWGRTIATSTGLTISATVAYKAAWDRSVAPGLEASVTIVKVFGRKITTTTGLTVNAVISRVVAYKRSTQANLSVAVTVVKLRARTIITTANLTINTIISRVVAYNRTIQAGLSIAVSIVRQFSRTIIMSPNLTINVLVDRVVAWNRAISSGLTIAVTVIRVFGATITTAANLVIDVTITRGFGWVITTTANLKISVIVRYCVGIRELLRVSIDRLDAQRLAISRMAISRVPISRKEIWRRIRSCFP